MAIGAVARETVFALRREIARIEGVLPERLEASEAASDEPAGAGVIVRRGGIPGAAVEPLLRTGVERFDAALGGGVPYAALTEIHGQETRDAGAAAGFALALAALASGRMGGAPLLWIGVGDMFREAGRPYALGLLGLFGVPAEILVLSDVGRIEDALWVAEEAASLTALSAVLLEIRGSTRLLDLTATRRLHRRAQAAGRPLYLLRHAAFPEPTAAPVRFAVAPAPAGERRTLSGSLHGSIGPPSFAVAITKNRYAARAEFTLEWNRDERAFHERSPKRTGAPNSGAVVPVSADGAYPAAKTGKILALKGAA